MCISPLTPNLLSALGEPGSDDPTINDLASYADLVLPGISEGKALMGSEDPEKLRISIRDWAQRPSSSSWAAKVRLSAMEVRAAPVPGYKVEKVVDTVGAGDGFAVGVISARLEGLP